MKRRSGAGSNKPSGLASNAKKMVILPDSVAERAAYPCNPPLSTSRLSRVR